MPKLPFQGFEASAHYRLKRGDGLCLRFRFPWDERFHERTTRWKASRNERRPFFEWARKFLFSGGKVDEGWIPTGEADALVLAKADETITLGEAVRGYLHDCTCGNKWLKPKADETLKTQTRPVLQKLVALLGESTPLVGVTGDQIAGFIRKLGGKKESKERHLCPVANLFTWAIREGHIHRENPARGVVFWREPGEEPHNGLRKSYDDAQFAKLLEAATTDPLAEDAIFLCRYLALRPQDAATLKWEDWHWPELLVAVRRQKTRESGVEVSHVDLHPVLARRYAHRRGATGFCLEYAGRCTKVKWPSPADLSARVEAQGATAVARELGVTEAAVRKRIARPTRVARITDRALSEDAERRALADSISQRVSKVTKAAGLFERGIQPLYILRHTFASDSLRRGVPPAIVAKEMGISVLTLEQYYFHAIPRGELDDRRVNRWGLERLDRSTSAGASGRRGRGTRAPVEPSRSSRRSPRSASEGDPTARKPTRVRAPDGEPSPARARSSRRPSR